MVAKHAAVEFVAVKKLRATFAEAKWLAFPHRAQTIGATSLSSPVDLPAPSVTVSFHLATHC